MKIKLILILLLTASLRFYRLGEVPSGFVNDEAAFGYNAYSLLKTGRDEFGKSWPVVFHSFGEGKLPVYIYLTMPSVAIFGLNEFAVRLPSAIFGTLTVLLIYLLGLKIGNWKLGISASFILSVMPWHIHFSRAAFEANVALFFVTAGVWLWQKKKPGWSLLSLIVSVFTYSAASVFVPLWSVYVYRRERKKTILLVLIPWIILLLIQSKFGRFGSISIFNPQSGVPQRLEQKYMESGGQPLWLTRLLHNKPVEYGLDFSRRYLSHLSPDFLFFQGDLNRPRYRAPDVGQLLLVTAPFLVIGWYQAVKKKKWWLLVWLFLALLPAALTFETPSAIRSILMAVPLALLIGLGFESVKKLRPIFVLALFINLLYYLDAYFVHLPVHQPYEWQGGYKKLVTRVNQLMPDYDKALITDSRGTAYIYFLFYNQYDPTTWQAQSRAAQTVPDKFGFTSINRLDNLYFIGETCPAKIPEDRVLYVCTQENHPKTGFTQFPETINFDDGQPAFVLFEAAKAEAAKSPVPGR
jgi:4-amino-4-deoxy-L-arabinose transferase-like glycosyltransferase